MIKKLCKLTLIAGVLALSTNAATACSRKAVSGTNAAIPAKGAINLKLLDRAILSEVNYTRCRAGISTLSGEHRLTKAAYKHSKWMAKSSSLTHRSNIAGQSSPKARMKSTGLKFRTGSENISRMYRYQLTGREFYVKDEAACHFADGNGRAIPPHSYASLAREAVRLWAESPKHRVNLMDKRMRITATAAAVDGKGSYCGSIYLTQNFLG